MSTFASFSEHPDAGRLLDAALRDVCAQFLGIEPGDLRLVTSAVGGGFGGKTPQDHEYVAVLDVMATPAGVSDAFTGSAPRIDPAEPLERALAFCRDYNEMVDALIQRRGGTGHQRG